MMKQWAIGIVMLLVLFVASAFAADMSYNATQYHNTTGVFTEGLLNATYWIDADLLNNSEVGGAPGFDSRFNFTGMAATSEGYIQFDFTVQYNGNPAHVVYFQFYNNSVDDWNTLTTIPEGDFNDYTLYALANHSKQGGIIMTRFYHTSPGNINHYFSINKLSATETAEVPTLVEEEFSSGSCPTDTLPKTILFIFFGILLVGAFWYCDTRGIGLGLLIVGVLTIFYSLPLYGCSIAWGLIATSAGLFIGLYAWKLKYY